MSDQDPVRGVAPADRPVGADPTAPSGDTTDATGPIERAQGSDRVFAGRFRLLARRGRATDIALFEAADATTGRTVALRIVHPDLCARPGFDERFRTTMDQVAAVRHPNLTEVIEVGSSTWAGRPVWFVVCENLTGGTLRDLHDRGRQLSASQVVMVGLEACRGLDAAHRAGLVHGGIRPNSIVFGDDGRVRIAELGLSSLVDDAWWDSSTGPQEVDIDRAKYASPEQARGEAPGAKSDVYSLDLCLLESVTGQLPFVADSSVATLAARVDRLLPVSADLGPLAAVLERAGRPDPDDRSSAAEFGRAMHQAAEKLPRPAPLALLSGAVAAAPATAGDATSPTGVRRPTPIVAATATGAAAAAGAAAVGDAPPTPADAGAGAGHIVGSELNAADRDPDELAVASSVDPPAMPVTATVGPPSPASSDDTVEAASAAPESPESPPAPEPTTPASAEPASVPAAAAESVWAPQVLHAPRAGEPIPGLPDDDRPARRRRRWPLVAAVVVLIALVAAAGVAWFGRTVSHQVPDLAGLDQGEALNLISGFDWEVAVVEQPDDLVPAGVVVGSEPTAGTSLAEGSAFTLLVSSGPAPRELPELTGRTVEEATSLLLGLGLVLEIGDRPFDEEVAPNLIVSWSVPDQPALGAGDTVLPGTAVVVAVSAGPAPRIVPDLTGRTVDEATAELEAQGLVANVLPEEFSPTVAVGGIARQDPAPGTEVERGATVSLAPSKGPDLVPVPPLAGLTVDQARAALEGAGLVLGEVKGDPAGLNVLAEVGGQSIGGGASFPRGTAVDLTFEVPAPPASAPPA